jgi:acetyl esterase/lipase
MSISTPELVQRATARDLSIDIFWPDQDTKKTAVILLHGGGWMAGHRSEMHRYASLLRAQGFLAVAAEYRLTGEALWPAQILDVKDIIRWVRANADRLRIDPEKIALQGFSAGGHLALLAAATGYKPGFGASPHPAGSAAVAAVAALFAPADLTKGALPVRPPPVANLLGPDADEDAARDASPLHHVAPGFPPVFLLSGMADPMMPYPAMLNLFEAVTAAGSKAELHLYHDHMHEFAALPSMTAAVQAEIGLFLNRAVVDPEFYRQENLALNPFARPGGPGGPPPGVPAANSAFHAAKEIFKEINP